MDNSKGDVFDGKNDFLLRFHRDTIVEIGMAGWSQIYGTIPGLTDYWKPWKGIYGSGMSDEVSLLITHQKPCIESTIDIYPNPVGNLLFFNGTE